MTEYVATADALFFHKILIERYGGALESALNRPQKGYYETIILEAAALMESLVQNHPFVEENKRVAFAVVDVLLKINGYSITAGSIAIHSHMLELLDTHSFHMEHLVPWLQEIVKPSANPGTRAR